MYIALHIWIYKSDYKNIYAHFYLCVFTVLSINSDNFTYTASGLTDSLGALGNAFKHVK